MKGKRIVHMETLFNRVLKYTLYMYIQLPIAIFMVGWLDVKYAVLFTTILIACNYRIVTKQKDVFAFKIKYDKERINAMIVVGIVIAFWVYLSGIGGLCFQTSDHTCRNAIFEKLVNEEWPVVGQYQIDGGAVSTVQLVYYIGFWLPAAVFGKIFGITAGYYFQMIWAFIGVFLTFMLICNYFDRVKVWYIFTLILFSGWDIVGVLIMNPDMTNMMYYVDGESVYSLGSVAHLEWWCNFQFSSFTSQLFWVFNQAIPCWIVLLMIIQMKKNNHMILIMGSLLLCSSFPFIGIIPFAVHSIFNRDYGCKFGKDWIKYFIRDTFTFENVVGGGITGIISYLYLRANYSSHMKNSNVIQHSTRAFLMMWIIFILLEVGVYFIMVYKFQKKNALFYISLCWLAVCPLFSVGTSQDFCMRASIPALLILVILIIDSVQKMYDRRKYINLAIIVCALIIGAVTPLHEINRSVRYTADAYYTNENIMQESSTHFMEGGNFSGYTEDDLFYRVFAKK